MARPIGKPNNKRAKAPDASHGTATTSQTKGNNMPRKRGRPRKSVDQSQTEGSQTSSVQSKPSKLKATASKRPRTSTTHEEQQEDEFASIQRTSKPLGSKKRKSHDAGTSTEHAAPPRKRAKATFAHLKPRTRHIPQTTITSKWAPAPLSAQSAIKALLHAAKHPVIAASAENDRRRIEAEVTLASVLRKLEKQLPKMPFPPRTREALFDLNKVVEGNRTLEVELTTGAHSVELLRAAVEKEEEGLRMDREILRELEENARAEEREHRRREKRVHPLLKAKSFAGVDDGVDDINLVPARKTQKQQVNVEGDDDDEELAPVLEHLSNHLESMEANSTQVEGVDDAIEGVYAALDGVLSKYATQEQYTSVMGK